MRPAGDHIDNDSFGPLRQAEIAIRQGHAEGWRIRSESLYVYSDKDMSERDWSFKKGRYLYELEIEENDIIHRGDLQNFHEVVSALGNGLSAEDLVQRYWSGAASGRYAELLAGRATVTKVLRTPSDYRSPTQRAQERLRDDPDNISFYHLHLMSRTDKSNR